MTPAGAAAGGWALPPGSGAGDPPAIWGIVNVTPDSFSDGGQHADSAAAVRHGLALLEQGADILDIGGESTRPGASEVSLETELARVLPVLKGLRAAAPQARLSIDTRRGAVAEAAIPAGASIVNDVSAGRDPHLLEVVARNGVDLVLMHMQGTPQTMQHDPNYESVVAEVVAFLLERARAAQAAGVCANALWIDPGIGFGKSLAHNLALLGRLDALRATGYRVLLGASRKRFLGELTGRGVTERLGGSLACAVRAWQAGLAGVRVHDVAPTRDLFTVLAHAIGHPGRP